MAGYEHSQEYRTIYVSITDHINKYPYKLLDIPSYTENLSDYELDPFTGGPLRFPIPGEVTCGMYTINWMIQAYHDHIPFSFERPSDVCHVAWKLSEYVNNLKNVKRKLNKAEEAYLEKAIIFLSVMNKNVKIVLSRCDKLKLIENHSGEALFRQFVEAAKGI